ncbi:MAG: hypothetical protein AAGE89_03470 [Pseudomonadota bacterium]
MRKIGVICGMLAEIETFERAASGLSLPKATFDFRISGASSRRATRECEALFNEGAELIISYGLAGALDPRHKVGDVIYSSHVVTALDESYGKRPEQTAETLKLRAGPLSTLASVCGVDEILFEPEDKARLFRMTRAGIADMESHAAARAAGHAGKPFIVLRSISDGAQDRLPHYVGKALGEDGKPKILPVLMGLAAHPGTLPALLRLQKNTKLALETLEAETRKLLPVILGR